MLEWLFPTDSTSIIDQQIRANKSDTDSRLRADKSDTDSGLRANKSDTDSGLGQVRILTIKHRPTVIL